MPVDPVGLPGLATMMTGFAAFLLALLVARLRRARTAETMAARARRSWLGLALQSLGIGITGFGPLLVTLDPESPKALAEATVVGLCMAGAVGLFVWATATMGQNWSLVARTRSDHILVTSGPFAWMRHPIYTAMGLLMVALSIAFGHTAHLLVAVPIFALGTWLRIREEERLLRDAFGAAYDAYAGRVKRFVPGVF